MKSVFGSVAILLATVGMPATAAAQDAMPAPQIIVIGKYQKDWDKGSKLEAEGLVALEKAKKDLVRYSADVVDAQNKRDGSRARSEHAAAEFRKLTSNITYFSDAEEAARWARQVEKAASQWAKYAERRGDGRKELDAATRKQSQAQSAVDKAQAKVDRGRAMKAEAERLSRIDGRG
ncbi:hypothetical protein [Tsuneonella sp. SYSU-LHT278]|uniref:hypothetical protein n=1 Tax=Tsuneonella sediminis TaxID=3416089 RepID=UPI003F79FCCF